MNKRDAYRCDAVKWLEVCENRGLLRVFYSSHRTEWACLLSGSVTYYGWDEERHRLVRFRHHARLRRITFFFSERPERRGNTNGPIRKHRSVSTNNLSANFSISNASESGKNGERKMWISWKLTSFNFRIYRPLRRDIVVGKKCRRT